MVPIVSILTATSTKSSRMQTITNNGETLTYTYDDRGYILSVTKNEDNS